MNVSFLTLAQLGSFVFSVAAVVTLWAYWTQKQSVLKGSLLTLSLLGPVTLLFCWIAQDSFFDNGPVLYWARLMSGDVSSLWGLGSLGLIAGSGLALGALSLQDCTKGLWVGAVVLALTWFILLLHPTPHYVPIPAWLDKLVWLGVLAGGGAVCVFIHLKLKDLLKPFQGLATIAAGIVPLLALLNIAAYVSVSSPLDLASKTPANRIKAPGCLSCHSMNGEGYPDPGGGLESAGGRTPDTILAFLKEPTPEKAIELGIRQNPTGEMANLQLTPQDAELIKDALVELFKIEAPSSLAVEWEQVEPILTEKTCLACHSLGEEGAPGGGIGGPFKKASEFEMETLIAWLQEPSMDKAKELGIREQPIGAMASFALDEERAKLVASWLKSLGGE